MKQTSIVLMRDERGVLVWHPNPHQRASANGTAERRADNIPFHPMAPNAPFQWQADGACDEA